MQTPEIRIHPGFWPEHAELFSELEASVEWDRSMKSRLTASYGLPYDYSQLRYPYRAMLPALVEVCRMSATLAGFAPNSCLLNYYPDGQAKMGFHADRRENLSPRSAVLILSLGAARSLQFRRIGTPAQRVEYRLEPGSLVIVPHAVQTQWQHAIPREADAGARISATLREVVEDSPGPATEKAGG